jgi:hypothetical protein
MTLSSAEHTAPLSSHLSAKLPPELNTEFIIYSFQKDENSKGSPVWQEFRRLDDEQEAFRRADALFLSSKFTRVEVRRKSVDASGKIVNDAVRILDAMPRKSIRMPLFFAGAALCSCAAFVIALYHI